MRFIFLFGLYLIVFSGGVFSQTDSLHTWWLRANVHRGLVLPEYGFIDYLVNDYMNAYEVSIVRQTRGKSMWEQMYHYPSWGISLYYGGLGNRQVFGHQLALFPYFICGLVRAGPFSLDGEMGIGLSYATRKFDLTTNPLNIAIGSHLNVHYRAELMARLRFKRRCMLHVGIAFNHLSNANLAEPNIGLNCGSLNAGLWYAVSKPQPVETHEIPRWKPRLFLEGRISAGLKHTRTFESFQYAAGALSVDGKFRWSHRFAAGIGGDLFYDASVRPLLLRMGRHYYPRYSYMSGIHATAEAYFGKAAFSLQQGMYVGLLPHLVHDRFYNRFVINYHFTDHFFASLSFKSRLVILDYMEFGVGFRL
jgi:hypothetical protein